MRRRVKTPSPSPLTFASRSLTAQAAGNVKELEDEFKADKVLKDSKIATLESDKTAKDTRVAALESDKNAKDTKMSTMESDMTALTTRVAALETLGIRGISNAVSWTNLTEINLSGEKLTNGDFSSVTNNAPTNWSVHSGTLDQTKLASGIVDGTGGAVAIQQMFPSSINANTSLVCKVTRSDNGVGTVYINTLNSGGISSSPRIHIDPSVGYVEFTRTDAIYGLRLSTDHGLREVSDISLFQGAVSGGTVQAYAGGGLEKISGTGGWNAGASSVQKIDGNADGYVQFQWNSYSARVGLKYSDTDYDVDSPYLHINYATNTVGTKSVSPGDWFRIRHYAATNEIKYQRKETVYSQNTNFVFETASGSNYQYISTERPTVISLDGSGNLTIGELYEVYTVRASDQALYLRDLDGNAKGYHGQGTRGTRFEVVEEAGQDYVSFYTEPTLTNGNDLYVDVSLYHVGARINDVTIVT